MSYLRQALCAALAAGLPLGAQATTPDIADLSIEELAGIRITSVSKRPEPLADAAASVFVITRDDLRRAGVQTLPEALRLAPNLQVASGANGSYAISARGMNGSLNSAPNKLLVLIDGRSVYSPLFSGVFWDVQDVLLDTVERIEVISGPGGVLWGVNAVNGVINVITRKAQDVPGTMASATLGNRGADAGFSQGAGAWRVYGHALGQHHSARADGGPVSDRRRFGQLGLRGDWARGNDVFSLNANAYRSRIGQPAPGAISVSGTSLVLGDIDSHGANLTASWARTLADGGMLEVQGYLDHTRRVVPPTFAERLAILDLQLQHTLPAMGRHSLAWGANVRHSRDRVENSIVIAFLPPDLTQRWTSLFAQDTIVLSPALTGTLGARAEHNDYTGLELLPTARLAWKPAPGALWWGGLSRTVRAPSRLDVDAYIPGHPPYLLNGGRQVRSEVARVLEVGYRGQPAADLSYAVTVFHNRYDHLRTQEIAPTLTYLEFGSKMQGKATGMEMWANWQLARAWRLTAGLATLHEQFWTTDGSNDVNSPGTVGRDPPYNLKLRAAWDVAEGHDLSLALRRTGRLSNPDVPSWTAVDAAWVWQVRKAVELALVGRNLNGGHAEYGPAATRAEIPRTVSLQLTWRH